MGSATRAMGIATILGMDTVITHMDTTGPIGTTAITTDARTTTGTATTATIGIIIATTDTSRCNNIDASELARTRFRASSFFVEHIIVMGHLDL